MAFELTKEELKLRDRLATKIAEASDALEDALDDFNRVVEHAWKDVAAVQEVYNTAVAEVRAFVSEVHDQRAEEYDQRPEKWQESEEGVAAAAWLEEWEYEFDDAEFDIPEPLDPPDLVYGEILNALPESSED
jgi:CRISPR/Cas system-associated exonuclease Cas4 (RecB family)